MYKILSIDGGGIRGLIPALFLAEIEERTGKPISEIFDLIIGTSTGGILACALTLPDISQEAPTPKYTAKEVVDFYFEEGERIFKKIFGRGLFSLGFLFKAKYPITNLSNVLKEYFGEVELAEALTEVITTSYETEVLADNYFFKSEKARNRAGENYAFWQAATATSAAPTYFEPLKLGNHCLIDGGISMGNPAQEAINEALSKGIDLKDILLVSLGTGETHYSQPYTKVKKWGLAEWVQPLIKFIFRSNANKVNYAMRQLLPLQNYYRFSPILKEEIEMDDASFANLSKMEGITRAEIEEKSLQISILCKKLLA